MRSRHKGGSYRHSDGGGYRHNDDLRREDEMGFGDGLFLGFLAGVLVGSVLMFYRARIEIQRVAERPRGRW